MSCLSVKDKGTLTSYGINPGEGIQIEPIITIISYIPILIVLQLITPVDESTENKLLFILIYLNMAFLAFYLIIYIYIDLDDFFIAMNIILKISGDWLD